MTRLLPVAVALAGAVLLAGCGGSSEPVSAGAPSSSSTTSTPVTATSTPTASATRPPSPTSPTSTRPVRPSPTTRATPTTRSSPARRSRPSPTTAAPAVDCAAPSGLSASQVLVVRSSGSRATVRACTRRSGRWVTDLGPYAGHVGANGVSSAKREGDLRTPTGVFGLRQGFGANADPGLRAASWLRVDGSDVWVDDPASELYNTHQRSPAGGRWDSAEQLLNTPAYRYAQVIGYNEARTPGRGSAIFLHVDLGHGTAGCVSLPTDALLAVLRWERSGAVIAIS